MKTGSTIGFFPLGQLSRLKSCPDTWLSRSTNFDFHRRDKFFTSLKLRRMISIRNKARYPISKLNISRLINLKVSILRFKFHALFALRVKNFKSNSPRRNEIIYSARVQFEFSFFPPEIDQESIRGTFSRAIAQKGGVGVDSSNV